MRSVTLYTKPGCHLCEAAEQVIAQVCRSQSIEFQILDILDDPDVYDRYKHDVPVILLDGKEIARHRLSVRQLEQALGA